MDIQEFITELDTEETPTATMKVMHLFRKGELNPDQRSVLFNYIDSKPKGKAIQQFYQKNTDLINKWVERKKSDELKEERKKLYIPLPKDKYIFYVSKREVQLQSKKDHSILIKFPIYIGTVEYWNNNKSLNQTYSEQETKELLQTLDELNLVAIDASMFISSLETSRGKMTEEFIQRGFKQIPEFDSFINNSEDVE
jgi:hypothetical protein